MSLVDSEIEEIKKTCENVVPNSKIIALNKILIRIDIKSPESKFRQLTACLRLPVNYPDQVILIELKSKTLSQKFLDGLSNLAEDKCKEILGKPQIIHVLKFLEFYLRENPLCVAFDEIFNLRKAIGETVASEQLKLKQKSSTVQLIARGGQYFYKIKAEIPKEYPEKCVILHDPHTNLPNVLLRFLNGQSREIARKCVEPPIRQQKKNAQPFEPKPSLYKTLRFCIDATFDFHQEKCPICDENVLPQENVGEPQNETQDSHVERAYCGHLYHQGCIKKYMSEPPFPKEGKLCPAKKVHPRSDSTYVGNSKFPVTKDSMNYCGIRLAHDRWVVNIKLAESRWAQKQARERELAEVVDFMK